MRRLSFYLLISSLCLGAASPAFAAGEGWLYIHRYLSDSQLRQYHGIAVPPFYVFREDGSVVGSDRPDGRQRPGRLIEVPAGQYYVVSGERNLGPTRVSYGVVAGRTTVIKTGFVQVVTWKSEELPREDCAAWNAELTAYVKPKSGDQTWLPVLSNPEEEYQTREFGMLQLLTGTYRIEWHGFGVLVDIREGKLFRLPVGTAGPLGDDQPKGRLSRRQGENADNPSLQLCGDGPAHVLAGSYWLSFARRLDVFPYEERVGSSMVVDPINQHGYVRRFSPDVVRKRLHTGASSVPTPAPLVDVQRPKAQAPAPGSPEDKARQDKARDLLGGDGFGIDWEAPP